ncbi:MAG: zinc ABC transporter substrate-binding protein [Clostridia bacterium]|nr:zinc ABC transporter substrate-binding protein [Clostridia bacterium]
MKKIISVIVIVTALLVLCSCGTAEEKKQDGLSIVCTAFPQYDFIKNILGTDEGLTLLLDDGGDLHSYEPTAQDIIKISSADIFVYVGGISDQWVDGVLASANNQSLRTVALMELVETYDEEYVAGMEHEHHHEGESHRNKDEHVWLSLKNAASITEKLCGIICETDSENTDKYKANTKAYTEELDKLDSEYQSTVASAKRSTLLFADRFPFRYLVEDYSLEYYAAFAGCSSESEASFQTMAFLINKTKESDLPVVLTIDGSDGSIAKTVCEASGAKAASLDSCQSVSLADITSGTTYVGIMKKNLEVLREALN